MECEDIVDPHIRSQPGGVVIGFVFIQIC
jgi:hypothetical protein